MKFPWWITMIVLAAGSGAWGQTTREFEVASIRPSHSSSDESNIDSTQGGLLRVTNANLRELIRLAFGVKDYQIAKAPGWIDRARYDIAAKAPGRDERRS